MQKTLLTLFGFDLATLLDDTFIEDNFEVNELGMFIKKFHKDFVDETYNIFERIEITDFGETINVTFQSFKLDKLYIISLIKLIDDLVNIYGKDRYGFTYFVANDYLLLNSQENCEEIRCWEHDVPNQAGIDLIRNRNLFRLIIFEIKPTRLK